MADIETQIESPEALPLSTPAKPGASASKSGLASTDYAAEQDGDRQRARTLYLVKQLEMVVRARMEAIVRSCDLTVPRYTAMTILDSSPDISSADLARRTFVSAQAANELVIGLRRRGLVERRPDPGHAKIVLLRLTDSGREALERCAPQVEELERRMLTELGPEASAGFRRTLRASIYALQPRDD